MSHEEMLLALEALKQANERALASPEEARRTLEREGVYTKDGQLAEPYR